MNLTAFEQDRVDGIAARLAALTQRDGECLIWKGRVEASGYGRFRFVEQGKKRQTSAHRAAYIIAHGSAPADLVIDHLCRNRLCVRPEHLEAVTQSENVDRGMWPLANRDDLGSPITPKSNCPRGHELTAENTYLHPKVGGGSGRECRVCKKLMRPPTTQASKDAHKKRNDDSRLSAVSHRSPWTEEETRLVLESRSSDAEIAALTGRTISAIRNRRQRHAE